MMHKSIIQVKVQESIKKTVLTLLIFTGCRDVPVTEPFLAPEQMLYALDLNHPAASLALSPPYDTVTLLVKAYNGLGELLPDTLTFKYSATASQVVVSSEGVVRGIRATSPNGVAVQVSTTYHGVTQSVTANIFVTDVAQPRIPKMLSFGLGINDTLNVELRTPFGTMTPITIPVVTDSNNSVISGALIAYRAADPKIIAKPVTVANGANPMQWITSHTGFDGYNNSIALGVTTIIAKAHMYGVTVTDSIPAKVRETSLGLIRLTDTTRVISEPVIYRGGSVIWLGTYTQDSIDIEFESPQLVDQVRGTSIFALLHPAPKLGGNIEPFYRDPVLKGDGIHPSVIRGRSFSEPGIYKWKSTRIPRFHGVVTVR